jgi:dTDP-4-dehydrorhamnose 3,5-epimerase
MALTVIPSDLPEVLIIKPPHYSDHRGFFMETHHQARYAEAGLDRVFVQDNHSHSKKHVLRGLHYQLTRPQGKLVFVVSGEIFDVAVDIRQDSPTFGRWAGACLSAENKHQIFVPEGFAHGFVVLSASADVIYKCTDVYAPGDEYGIYWADPAIAIDWPVQNPILSDKDQKCPLLSDAGAAGHLPLYHRGS